jgi:hypothetical protein
VIQQPIDLLHHFETGRSLLPGIEWQRTHCVSTAKAGANASLWRSEQALQVCEAPLQRGRRGMDAVLDAKLRQNAVNVSVIRSAFFSK